MVQKKISQKIIKMEFNAASFIVAITFSVVLIAAQPVDSFANIEFLVSSLSNPDAPGTLYRIPRYLIPEGSLLATLNYLDDYDYEGYYDYEPIPLSSICSEQYSIAFEYLRSGCRLPIDICTTCSDPVALHRTLLYLANDNEADPGAVAGMRAL